MDAASRVGWVCLSLTTLAIAMEVNPSAEGGLIRDGLSTELSSPEWAPVDSVTPFVGEVLSTPLPEPAAPRALAVVRDPFVAFVENASQTPVPDMPEILSPATANLSRRSLADLSNSTSQTGHDTDFIDALVGGALNWTEEAESGGGGLSGGGAGGSFLQGSAFALVGGFPPTGSGGNPPLLSVGEILENQSPSGDNVPPSQIVGTIPVDAGDVSVPPHATANPEPSSLAMFVVGLVALIGYTARQRGAVSGLNRVADYVFKRRGG